MDRKSGYKVDMESMDSPHSRHSRHSRHSAHSNKRESMRDSMRSSSVSSGSLSSESSSSIHSNKNRAPKILGLILGSVLVVSVVVGVTFYLLELEKESLVTTDTKTYYEKVYSEEGVSGEEDGRQEEIDITEEIIEEIPQSTKRTSIADLLKRQTLLEMAKQRLMLLREQRIKSGGTRRKVDEFLRASKADESVVSSLLAGPVISQDTNYLENAAAGTRTGPGTAGRRTTGRTETRTETEATATDPASTSTFTSTKGSSEDLEFGGVGLFGVKTTEPNHRYEADEAETLTTEETGIRTLQNMGRQRSKQVFRDIYDMAGYGNTPRSRQRILRPGLEGRHRGIDGEEAQLTGLEDTADPNSQEEEDSETSPSIRHHSVLHKNIINSDGSVRPLILPLSRQPALDPESSLGTIDRRPGRPTFHHQGPLGREEIVNDRPELLPLQRSTEDDLQLDLETPSSSSQSSLFKGLLNSRRLNAEQLRELRQQLFAERAEQQLFQQQQSQLPAAILDQLPARRKFNPAGRLPRKELLLRGNGEASSRRQDSGRDEGYSGRLSGRNEGLERLGGGRDDGFDRLGGREEGFAVRRGDGFGTRMAAAGYRDGGRVESGRRPLRRRYRGPPQAAKFQQAVIPEVSSADTQDAILDNFDQFIKLAGTELLDLKDVAHNITASGGEMNLWDIISAVNSTVREKPGSNIAKLISKFEDRYLGKDDKMEDNVKPADAVYERSLSSLLFLSMGIFLLNSVNELVDSGSLPGSAGEGRSLPTNTALQHFAENSLKHQEIFQLFNSSQFDMFNDNTEGGDAAVLDLLQPNQSASTLNTYVRLVMNLMNAYVEDSEEFECIYAAYCLELNQQAGLEGMTSSVARINSVGLRLALHNIGTHDTIAALIRSMVSWEELPCQAMFPRCNLEQGDIVQFS